MADQPIRISSPLQTVNFGAGSATSTSNAYESIAQALANASNHVQDRLDINAQIEGKKAGAIAGLDGVPTMQDDATIRGRAFNMAAMDTAETQFELKGLESLTELEKLHEADPLGFSQNSEAYLKGTEQQLVEGGFDPAVTQKLLANYKIRATNTLSRIEGRAQAISRDRQLENAILLQDTLREDIKTATGKIGSPDTDPAERAVLVQQVFASGEQLAKSAHQIGPDGRFLFSAEDRARLQGKVKNEVSSQLVYSWVNSQPDKNQALADLYAGKAKMVMNVPAFKEPQEVELFKIIGGEEAFKEIAPAVVGQIQREVALQESFVQGARTEKISNYEYAIKTTEDPAALRKLSEKIDDDAEFLGVVKHNDLKLAIFNQDKKAMADVQSMTRGAAYASGQGYLNPQDTEGVKDFNTYFSKRLAPELAARPVEERNSILSNVINSSKMIPDLVKGEIQLAARSQDVNQVEAAADLIDRISNTNPHLLQGVESKNLARIDMVRSLRQSGYSPEDALKKTDEVLSPVNAPNVEFRKQALQDAKFDFRAKAIDVFQPSFFNPTSFSFDDSEVGPSSLQVSTMTLDYKRAFESQFLLTGDEGLADQQAQRVVKGMYGTTNINGQKQVMKYPPEKYYAIPDVDSDWMSKQVKSQAKLSIKENGLPESIDLDDDIMIVPDPLVTPRTAKSGAPAYKLMYIDREDGTLRDLLGPNKFFNFDPAAVKQQIIKDAQEEEKARKEIKRKQARSPRW